MKYTKTLAAVCLAWYLGSGIGYAAPKPAANYNCSRSSIETCLEQTCEKPELKQATQSIAVNHNSLEEKVNSRANNASKHEIGVGETIFTVVVLGGVGLLFLAGLGVIGAVGLYHTSSRFHSYMNRHFGEFEDNYVSNKGRSKLEIELIKDIKTGKNIPLEKALLTVSGLKTKESVEEYSQKLDKIQEEFEKDCTDQADFKENKGKALFDYLWTTKPTRYKEDRFLLTNVIDAQLDPLIPEVGNSLGLTTLYTLLGLREKLDISVMQSNGHVWNIVKNNDKNYVVDSTSPEKFIECQQPANKKPASYLLSIFYTNYGIENAKKGNHNMAISNYNLALMLEPENQKALIGRALAKNNVGDCTGAISDINEAIRIDPKNERAFYCRGVIRSYGEDAILDFSKAIELNPNFAEAYHKRAGLLRLFKSRIKEAEADYNKAMELNQSLPRISFVHD